MTAHSGTRRSVVAGILLVVILLAAFSVIRFAPALRSPKDQQQHRQAAILRAGAFNPPYPAPELALQGSNGAEVLLSRYRGKVVLVTFGFTYCAAVCPTTLATLAQARSKLGKDADAVQVIFVTVDPARDNAGHMHDYLRTFDPTFVGATGTPEALAAARRAYGVTAEKHGTGPDYVMGHTSSIFLIDRAGHLRAMMPFGQDASDFVHDIQYLLTH